MTTAVETDYSQYVGQRVELTWNNPKADAPEKLIVNVTAFADGILLAKPKSKNSLAMIPVSEIEEGSFHLVEDGEKQITANKLDLVVLGKARAHLLERHGITLKQANGMTEEQGFEYHSKLDHVALDLGHVHVDKAAEKKARDEAKAAKAEPAAAAEENTDDEADASE